MRSLRRAGHWVAIACGSRFTPGHFSRYPDRRLLWSNYFEGPEAFTEQMLEYIRRRQPDITISVGDISAGIVARNREELLKYTRVTVPELKIFDRAADKGKTMTFCMENNIPCPKTFFPDEESLDTIVARAPFPVMVKPRRGIGAIGLHRFEKPEELYRHFNTLREHYGELIIQEFIPLEGGTQFQAEAFLDADSRMKLCMVIAKPRFFPVSGGTSTANVTIYRPDIQKNVQRPLEGIGWSGAADVDLILDPRDNVPKILEINSRVTAGIKIGFAAGIDYAHLHVRLALGLSIPKIDTYKLGIYSRNLCMDVLWYLFSDRNSRQSTWAGIAHAPKPDAIIATSPPLTVAITMWLLSVFYGVPAVFEVRDLWPETAIQAGVLTSKPIVWLSYRLEELAYRRASWINVLTPAFEKYLVDKKQVPANRISMIPNGADLDIMKPGPKDNEVRRRLGLADKFVVSYFGAHGLLNRLGQLLDVAERIKDSHPDICIMLVGDGMEKPMLIEDARRRGLDNVIFVDAVPKGQVVDYINASDVCTAVLMKNNVFKTVYPNKVFDYMACKRPIIIAIDGVARKLVEDAEAGFFVEPENPDMFIDTLLTLKGDAELAQRLGENGYRYVAKHYSRKKLASKYLEILQSLTC